MVTEHLIQVIIYYGGEVDRKDRWGLKGLKGERDNVEKLTCGKGTGVIEVELDCVEGAHDRGGGRTRWRKDLAGAGEFGGEGHDDGFVFFNC